MVQKKDPCYADALSVSNSIMRLIRLEVDRLQGKPVEDEIDFELGNLTANNLGMKSCILIEVKAGME